MKATLIFMLLCSLSACGGSQHYKDAAEFEAAISSWKVVGKTEAQANFVLIRRGFICKESSCSREVSGYPCLQRQHIYFVVGNTGVITEATVWKLPDGQLPTACV